MPDLTCHRQSQGHALHELDTIYEAAPAVGPQMADLPCLLLQNTAHHTVRAGAGWLDEGEGGCVDEQARAACVLHPQHVSFVVGLKPGRLGAGVQAWMMFQHQVQLAEGPSGGMLQVFAQQWAHEHEQDEAVAALAGLLKLSVRAWRGQEVLRREDAGAVLLACACPAGSLPQLGPQSCQIGVAGSALSCRAWAC